MFWYWQEIGEAPTSENNGQRQFMIPDFYTESDDDWNVEDPPFSKEMPRKYLNWVITFLFHSYKIPMEHNHNI